MKIETKPKFKVGTRVEVIYSPNYSLKEGDLGFVTEIKPDGSYKIHMDSGEDVYTGSNTVVFKELSQIFSVGTRIVNLHDWYTQRVKKGDMGTITKMTSETTTVLMDNGVIVNGTTSKMLYFKNCVEEKGQIMESFNKELKKGDKVVCIKRLKNVGVPKGTTGIVEEFLHTDEKGLWVKVRFTGEFAKLIMGETAPATTMGAISPAKHWAFAPSKTIVEASKEIDKVWMTANMFVSDIKQKDTLSGHAANNCVECNITGCRGRKVGYAGSGKMVSLSEALSESLGEYIESLHRKPEDKKEASQDSLGALLRKRLEEFAAKEEANKTKTPDLNTVGQVQPTQCADSKRNNRKTIKIIKKPEDKQEIPSDQTVDERIKLLLATIATQNAVITDLLARNNAFETAYSGPFGDINVDTAKISRALHEYLSKPF